MSGDESKPFRCVLCGCLRGTPEILRARDRYLGIDGEYDYFRCSACELVQQSPMPRDTSAFYKTYPVHARRSAVVRAARSILMPGVYYRPPKNTRLRVLDYGCGNGDFLDDMRSRGCDVIGYEIEPSFAERVSHLRGFPVYSDWSKLKATFAGTVDVITMHCVLEHLPNPDEVFDSVQALLRPGGALHVVLPHYDCWERRLFGQYWHALDPPRHLIFPDAPQLEAMAARHNMELAEHFNVRFPNNLSASISARLTGRVMLPLMLCFTPLAVVLQWIRPTGTKAFRFVRK